jgi:hypothetical protein
MSRNFLRITVLAVVALFTASATPSLLHATAAYATVMQTTNVSNGPGGNGGGTDPYPPCDDCVVRAL